MFLWRLALLLRKQSSTVPICLACCHKRTRLPAAIVSLGGLLIALVLNSSTPRCTQTLNTKLRTGPMLANCHLVCHLANSRITSILINPAYICATYPLLCEQWTTVPICLACCRQRTSLPAAIVTLGGLLIALVCNSCTPLQLCLCTCVVHIPWIPARGQAKRLQPLFIWKANQQSWLAREYCNKPLKICVAVSQKVHSVKQVPKSKTCYCTVQTVDISQGHRPSACNLNWFK